MTIITQAQYKVIYADGFGFRKDIMDAAKQRFLSMDSLPEALREMREEKRLVQSEAARSMGVCISSLSMWENGVRTPSWALLPIVAAAYGYKIEFVISKA